MYNSNNDLIQFLFICVLSQLLKSQWQSEHERKERNKHTENIKQDNF
jgi:hypothetical protein